MKMKKAAEVSFAAWFLVATVVFLVAEVHHTAAANCNPLGLRPCLAAIQGSGEPSSECCTELKEQVTCLCGYMKNPLFEPYVNSPTAEKVASTCGVAWPRCT